MLHSTNRIWVLALLIGMIASGCGLIFDSSGGNKHKGNSGTSGSGADDVDPPPATGEDSILVIAGTFAMLESQAANLQGPSYALNCTTFAEQSKSCRVPIDAAGSFSTPCEGYVGQPFGCYILENENNLATLEFTGISTSRDATVLAGRGILAFDITYNPDLQQATAIINMAQSTALSPEALAEIQGFVNARATVLNDLTGVWTTTCEIDELDGPTSCDGYEGLTPSNTVEFFQEQVGQETVVSLWEPEARAICAANGVEATPTFSFNAPGMSAPVSLDFANLGAFKQGIEQVVQALPGDLKGALFAEIDRVVDSETSYCDDSSYQARNPYSESNCKLVLGELQSYSFFNNAGEEVTEEYLKYFEYSEYGSLVPFTGTASTNEVTCSFRGNDGLPYCPTWATGTDNGDQATYMQHSFGGAELQLVCKVEQEEYLIQQVAPKPTLAESVAFFNATDTDDGCSNIAAGVFVGKKERFREVATQTILELINPSNRHDTEEVCQDFALPESFHLGQCDYSKHDIPFVCWDARWVQNALAGEINGNGKFEVTNAPEWYDYWIGSTMCPTTHAAHLTTVGEDYSGHSAEVDAASARDCQLEVAALSVPQLTDRIHQFVLEQAPPSIHLTCRNGIGLELNNKFKSIAKSSCAPASSYFTDCFGDSCMSYLECRGSDQNGQCYGEAGEFLGTIPKRLGRMTLRPQIEGAFELSDTVVERWQQLNYEQGGQDVCTYKHELTILAYTANNAAQDFRALTTTYSKSECGPPNSSSTAATGQGVDSILPPSSDFEEGAFFLQFDEPDYDEYQPRETKRLIFTRQ